MRKHSFTPYKYGASSVVVRSPTAEWLANISSQRPSLALTQPPVAMATPPLDCPSALGAGKLPRDVEPVFIADADYLARAVDSPASESSPLFRLMFPRLDVDFSEEQKDEIIQWHAEGIKDAIIGGRTYLRKIRHGDGTLVGLAGWVVERCPEEQANSNKNKTTVEAAKVGNEQKSECWLPGALDVSAWLKVSAAPKKERHTAIGHLDNVCRTLQLAPALMISPLTRVPICHRNNDYVHLSGIPTPRTRLYLNATRL